MFPKQASTQRLQYTHHPVGQWAGRTVTAPIVRLSDRPTGELTDASVANPDHMMAGQFVELAVLYPSSLTDGIAGFVDHGDKEVAAVRADWEIIVTVVDCAIFADSNILIAPFVHRGHAYARDRGTAAI